MIKQNQRKAGRPKGEPTDTVAFRVPTKLKAKAIKKYGKTINKIFKDWFKTI